jgi:hypothetical protein
MRGACIGVLGLAMLLVFKRPASSQSAAAAAARISGRVSTSDAKLLAGVIVTLTELTAAGRQWTTTSGPGGEFIFPRVPAGRYELSASQAGLTSRAVVGSRLVTGRELVVGDNDEVVDASLTLRRVSSIAGRVLRPEGAPAPDVQVMVALRDGARPVAITDTRVFSEWDGRYEIGNLPPGEYMILVLPLSAGAPARRTSLPLDVSPAALRFEPTLYPGVPQSKEARSVVVHEGVPVEGADVWLLPAPQRYTVSGRVFWPEGLQVRNVIIEYGGTPEVRSGIWYLDDPGGLFTLTGISEGTLVMLARGDSHLGPLAGMATTDVLAPIEEVRIVLRPTGSVAGRVVAERPLPPGTSPRVVLRHTLLRVSPLYPSEAAVVNANGAFEISHALGTYAIELHDLPAGWRVRRMNRNGQPLPDNRLVVGSGEVIPSIEIVVGPD